MRRFLRLGVSVGLLALAPELAYAQADNAPAGGSAQPSGAQPASGATAQPSGATAQPSGAQPQNGDTGNGDAKKPVSVPATGYGYGDKKTATATAAPSRRVRATPHASGPVATMPGFEMTDDGSSRVFVELSQNVDVQERKAAGELTYVMKGAHITRRNNANALVTVHFNTPVSRARLVPSGNDLLLVVDLRAANVTPAWKLNPTKTGGAIFTVEFPKGDYLPAHGVEPGAPYQPAPQDPQQAAPPAQHGNGGGGGGHHRRGPNG